MTSLEQVSIVITTYFDADHGAERVRAALEAARTWKKYFDHKHFHIHVADDGSVDKYLTFYVNNLKKIFTHEEFTLSSQQRQGVGASLNAGIRHALERSDMFLYLVDDWSLTRPFHLEPWIQALEDDWTIGMVRLGPPHPNIRGKIRMLPSGWVMVLDRYGYAYGQRPALYHQRFHEYYGAYPEHCSALECERMYNLYYANNFLGPDIVLALPDFWQHIDTVSMSGWEPQDD